METLLECENISENVRLVVNNALQMLNDKRLSKDEAQKYIQDWFLALHKNGQIFTDDERLFLKENSPKGLGVQNSIVWSIISIFK